MVIHDGRTEVARHERLMAKSGSRLDHYLEALVRKPGALPGATALDQARAAGKFTPVHDAWWEAARKAHGDAEGTCALIQVLLLHRHMPQQRLVEFGAAGEFAGDFVDEDLLAAGSGERVALGVGVLITRGAHP